MLNRGLDKLELLRKYDVVANEKSTDKELVSSPEVIRVLTKLEIIIILL